jgi:hypothetical protein
MDTSYIISGKRKFLLWLVLAVLLLSCSKQWISFVVDSISYSIQYSSVKEQRDVLLDNILQYFVYNITWMIFCIFFSLVVKNWQFKLAIYALSVYFFINACFVILSNTIFFEMSLYQRYIINMEIATCTLIILFSACIFLLSKRCPSNIKAVIASISVLSIIDSIIQIFFSTIYSSNWIFVIIIEGSIDILLLVLFALFSFGKYKQLENTSVKKLLI